MTAHPAGRPMAPPSVHHRKPNTSARHHRSRRFPIKLEPTPRRFSRRAVARILGITPARLDAAVKRGRFPLPDVVEGNARRWRASTILAATRHRSAWLRSNPDEAERG